MIVKSQIQQTLQSLDARYQAATSPEDAQWFAKLAIIELCGWIEESMDEVIWGGARRHLKVMANQELCEADIIAKTYGLSTKSISETCLYACWGWLQSSS